MFRGLRLVACGTSVLLIHAAVVRAAAADRDSAQFLGRWDMTLNAAGRIYSSWLDVDGDGEQLRVRMVGRWGHPRWLNQVAVADGRITFISPAADEGQSADLAFSGSPQGEDLVGSVAGPKGEAWTWRAQRAPTLSATKVLKRKPSIRLFDGKDTAGWDQKAAAKSWRVVDGTLVSQGSGADLRTTATYRDFRLHVEFNCAPGANSGVYLRGRYEVQIEDDGSDPLNQRSGGIYGFIAPRSIVPPLPGRWHAYDITLIGRQVTVLLDGKMLIDHEDIPGPTGGALDSREASPGPILLQGSEPGQVAYRNLILTPLVVESTPETRSPRIEHLLSAMTLDEKVAVIRGAHEPEAVEQGQAGWTAGVPRLGIPDLRFADGPPGVLVRHESTGMPATLSMAATFSTLDAKTTGALIGRDARALGIDVILQPYINMNRDPRFERAYNTLGEDPVLTGTLAASFVGGAQGENVMAQAKHFVAYEGADDVAVDGQALREIYIAPFNDVSRAGVASIMCSYNHIGGIYACDNQRTLNVILRGEDGYQGFVTSDWGAAHAAEFITHGLDMEQPGTGPNAVFAVRQEPPQPQMSAEELSDLDEVLTKGAPEEQRFPLAKPPEAPTSAPTGSKNLGEALAKGTAHNDDIDRAAARVLSQMERFGWLDKAPEHAVRQEAVEDNARLIRRLAERGSVLLKNEGTLPLRAEDLNSLALIGPGALQAFAIVNGLEQSYGRAEREIGPFEALKAAAPQVRAAVADDMTGVPIPRSALLNLKRKDAKGSELAPVDHIDRTLKSQAALPAGTNTEWNGELVIPAEGDYDIDLQILGATGKFSIDGRKVGDMGWWGGHGDIVYPNRDNVVPTLDGLDNVRRRTHLAAGNHALHVEVQADGSKQPVQVRLAWVTPAMRESDFQAAVELAKSSRVAVVFAWSRNRPFFGLPGDQDRLIEAVAAVNPNTVVVLNTGQAVAMPWLAQVRAVLEMWYTGDEGGWAAADLLTGRANPGGKLPISWPKRLEDYAAVDPRHPDRASFVPTHANYGEGIYVGYRWFDREKIEPLFAFGHGLSYSTFEYSGLTVTEEEDGGLAVRCRLRNSSARAGDAVVEAYLGPPNPKPVGAEFAERALAGFERVSLKAGEARTVTLHVAPERLRYWSTMDHAWHDERLGRQIYVGDSSRDLPLSAPVLAPKPDRAAETQGAGVAAQ